MNTYKSIVRIFVDGASRDKLITVKATDYRAARDKVTAHMQERYPLDGWHYEVEPLRVWN